MPENAPVLQPALPGLICGSQERRRLAYILFSLCSLSFLTIVDRVCISTAKSQMSRELGTTDTTFGWVFGAFAFGYTLWMIPAGVLIDRFGPRKILAIVVSLWSVLTAATGSTSSIGLLLVIRFVFGVAEAGAFPGAARSISNWLPVRQRGLALGLLNTGSRLGAAFGLSALAFCISEIGWRLTFALLGAAGIVWALVWFWHFRDYPVSDSTGLPAQVAISSSNEERRVHSSRAWSLLRSRSVYLILFQYFASQVTFFICFSWLLPYLESRYQLSTTVAGMYATTPLLFGALAAWIGGSTVDILYRKGKMALSRPLPAICGFGLACAAILIASCVSSVGDFVLFFALATFGVDLTLSPSWTVCADIGGEHVGTLSAAMNMMGSLGALASAVLFPFLVKLTGNARSYFYLAAALNACGLFCWIFLFSDYSPRKDKAGPK